MSKEDEKISHTTIVNAVHKWAFKHDSLEERVIDIEKRMKILEAQGAYLMEPSFMELVARTEKLEERTSRITNVLEAIVGTMRSGMTEVSPELHAACDQMLKDLLGTKTGTSSIAPRTSSIAPRTSSIK